MSEEQSLEKQEENQAAPVVNSLDGVSDTIDKSDINFARLTIIQPTSQQSGATVGKIYDAGTGEEFDEIKAVFINVGKSRVRWPQDGSFGEDPLCRSRDAKTGEGDPGGNCPTCRYAQWINDQKPECQLKYDFIGVDYDTSMPFFLSIGGTSFAEGKKLLTKVFKQSKKEGRNIPLYAFIVTITPYEVVSKKGKFYKYNFHVSDEMSEEEIKYFQEVRQELLKAADNEGDGIEDGEYEENSQSGENKGETQAEQEQEQTQSESGDDDIKIENVPF